MPGSAGQWFLAAQAMHRLLSEVAGVSAGDPLYQQPIALPSGKALAPIWAAHCIQDFLRTRVFLRGVLQAIEACRQRFPHTPLQVLYAGTGPFAALALPLFPLLDPEKVRFTFLEISPQSIACLEKVLTAFAFEPWVSEIICADATTYQAAEAPHMVIMEMMQAGLRREPQVAACLHLAPQMVPGGCMIPQRIRIQAGLIHPQRDLERIMGATAASEPVLHELGSVFELSEYTALPATGVFPEVYLEFPEDQAPGFSQLALLTKIQVYQDETLRYWDSGLTQPLLLHMNASELQGQTLGFQYQLGPDPGFHWRTRSKS